MNTLDITRLNTLKNFINECLTENNELDVEYFETLSSEDIKDYQYRTNHLINIWETRRPFSGNVDMTVFLDQLYKIRNGLDVFIRNREISDAPVAYGGIHYKRRTKRPNKRTKRRLNRRSKRLNKRNKRTKRRYKR